MQDQHLLPEGPLRLDRRHVANGKVHAFRQFVGDVGDDLARLCRLRIGARAAFDADRGLHIVLRGIEDALVADHQNVERVPVSVIVEAEAEREMSRLLDRFLDCGDLLRQKLFQRTGDVLTRRLVNLLRQRALLLVHRGEGGDVGFKRDMQIGLVNADVDVLGKAPDQSIRLAEARAALEVQTDRIVAAPIEQEVERPADIEVLLDIRGLRLEMRGDRLEEGAAIVDARAQDFNERLLHDRPSRARCPARFDFDPPRAGA